MNDPSVGRGADSENASSNPNEKSIFSSIPNRMKAKKQDSRLPGAAITMNETPQIASTPRSTTATAQGGRSHQEDRTYVKDGLAIICDGHGGDECANDVIRALPKAWKELFDDTTESIEEIFRRVASITAFHSSGCSCSLALLYPNQRAVVAILGDSPVIVKRDGEAITFPCHNAQVNDTERDAAIKRGAWYAEPYLWNNHGQGLQMSRAFGDASLSFISQTPDIYPLAGVEWIALVTDGAFDNHHDDPLILAPLIEDGADAQDIVDRALALRTGDNVTAIILS